MPNPITTPHNAGRILVWFALNPTVPMSIYDLSRKFQWPPKSLGQALRNLMRRGYITRVKMSNSRSAHEIWHYLPGPLLLEEIER